VKPFCRVISTGCINDEFMQNWITEMGKLDWEIVSVFPSVFPAPKQHPGEQPGDRNPGPPFTFVFKRKISEQSAVTETIDHARAIMQRIANATGEAITLKVTPGLQNSTATQVAEFPSPQLSDKANDDSVY
jgi:hypothetical protein